MFLELGMGCSAIEDVPMWSYRADVTVLCAGKHLFLLKHGLCVGLQI